MTRQEILDQIEGSLGLVPDVYGKAPEGMLESLWSSTAFFNADTVLSAREKVLVAFGAAAAIHCEY